MLLTKHQAVQFAKFIHAHNLNNSEIQDSDYLEDLLDNFLESFSDPSGSIVIGVPSNPGMFIDDEEWEKEMGR